MIWQLSRTGWISGEYAIYRNTRGGFRLEHRHRLVRAECGSTQQAKDVAQADALKKAAKALKDAADSMAHSAAAPDDSQ